MSFRNPLTSLPAGSITGQIIAAQIESVNAAAVLGQLTADQIAAVNAGAITGQLTADQIAAVAAAAITGQLTAAQIAAVEAAAITGKLTATQIASVAATAVQGQLTADQIAAVNAGAITGQLTATQIAAVDAAAIIGKLTATQIAAVEAAAITGQLTAAQIAAVAAAAITGQLTATQIESVDATTVQGTLTADQIAAVNAGAITGQLTADQIAAVQAGAILGQLTAAQIAAVEATAITGQLTAAQIAAVEAAAITGQLTAAQIAAVDAATITGPIAPAQLGSGTLANGVAIRAGSGSQIATGDDTGPRAVFVTNTTGTPYEPGSYTAAMLEFFTGLDATLEMSPAVITGRSDTGKEADGMRLEIAAPIQNEGAGAGYPAPVLRLLSGDADTDAAVVLLPSGSTVDGGVTLSYDTATGALATVNAPLLAADTTDASIDPGNVPPLRVGNPAGTHLRVDGNEILAMTDDATQGTLFLNLGGTTGIANLSANKNLQTGHKTSAALASGATVSIPVTFSATMSSVPAVAASSTSYRYTVGASGITTTGFNLLVSNYSGGAGATVDVSWLAIAT